MESDSDYPLAGERLPACEPACVPVAWTVPDAHFLLGDLQFAFDPATGSARWPQLADNKPHR